MTNQAMERFRVDDLSVFERNGATVQRRPGRAGCWVKLDGWTLSIQWSAGTYSSNHDAMIEAHDDVPDATEAEIAIWPDGGGMVTWADGDTVQGWCSLERVLRVLDLLSENGLLRADDRWTEPEA